MPSTPNSSPPEPRHHIDLARRRVQSPTDAPDQTVAGRVALAVVRGLEPVEIDHEHRGRVAVAAAAFFFCGKQPVPGTSVEKAGERIGLRLDLQPLVLAYGGLLHALGLQQAAEQARHQFEQRLLGRQLRRLNLPVERAPRAQHFALQVAQRQPDAGADRPFLRGGRGRIPRAACPSGAMYAPRPSTICRSSLMRVTLHTSNPIRARN